MPLAIDKIDGHGLNNTPHCEHLPRRLIVTTFAKRDLIYAQFQVSLFTVIRHTTIDQQFMLVPLPKLQRSAFTKASFTCLSDIHGCSGGL